MPESEPTVVDIEDRAGRKLVVARNPPEQRRPALSPQVGLREVMSQFATGVTVLTTGSGDTSHGMTANAFTSVSLDPPLVLCCVARAARMHETILSARCFAVSILCSDQQDVAEHFADWKRPKGQPQFADVSWHQGNRTGSPLLSGALAWLECELVTAHEGGDHSIFVGEVVSWDRSTGADRPESSTSDALLFFGGRFHRLGQAAA